MTNQLTYRGYIGTVEYSAEDDILFGKIIGISDSITYEGSNIQEIKNNFEESVDDYLELCKEIGKDPLPTLTGQFNVRTTTENHRMLKILADMHNRKLNTEVNQALSAWIQQNRSSLSRTIFTPSKRVKTR